MWLGLAAKILTEEVHQVNFLTSSFFSGTLRLQRNKLKKSVMLYSSQEVPAVVKSLLQEQQTINLCNKVTFYNMTT